MLSGCVDGIRCTNEDRTQVLKKKKLVEKQLEELSQHQLNIEGLVMQLPASSE